MSDQTKKVVEINDTRSAAKVCRVCGDAIAHTRRAERDWDRIQYCSAVCRRAGIVRERTAS